MKLESPKHATVDPVEPTSRKKLGHMQRFVTRLRFGDPTFIDPASVDNADHAVLIGENTEAANHPDLAIAFFRRALTLDPAHARAISGLGRLQFSKPDQPFLDELRKKISSSFCEAIIEVRNPCNYRCFYCVTAGYNNVPVKEFDLAAINRTLSEIKADLLVISFDCGGGEPTIHPQFPELLRVCASHGAVSFPTNNSQDPERWLPKDLAGRLSVRAAVHPETETKTGLDRYAKHARMLIDAGCDFTSTFISHPTRLSKIPEYQAYFSERGVPFVPVGFIGEYEGRSYPYAYTDEEKAIIGLVEGEVGWFQRIQPHTNRIRNFRGIPCLAGNRSLYIRRNGGVNRCAYDQRKLDKPLDQAEPCAVKHCGCGLVLRDLNVIDAPDNYNYWAERRGLVPVDMSWMDSFARQLGYESREEALLKEHSLMYDEIMRAYGKNDFPE